MPFKNVTVSQHVPQEKKKKIQAAFLRSTHKSHFEVNHTLLIKSQIYWYLRWDVVRLTAACNCGFSHVIDDTRLNWSTCGKITKLDQIKRKQITVDSTELRWSVLHCCSSSEQHLADNISSQLKRLRCNPTLITNDRLEEVPCSVSGCKELDLTSFTWSMEIIYFLKSETFSSACVVVGLVCESEPHRCMRSL